VTICATVMDFFDTTSGLLIISISGYTDIYPIQRSDPFNKFRTPIASEEKKIVSIRAADCRQQIMLSFTYILRTTRLAVLMMQLSRQCRFGMLAWVLDHQAQAAFSEVLVSFFFQKAAPFPRLSTEVRAACRLKAWTTAPLRPCHAFGGKVS
jgi:hypothetical protein